ncbi:LAMI_0D08240g1_1 [Lachancea mirantina]|uniref:LAMI_0D08240g1_1 n=1 Tax=Lachancea mirantina TaxID=1230905 RepID=A0A1G4JDH2_9SACH|nr:LAMI_0D08240g1_1 [Lachancea mirantina]
MNSMSTQGATLAAMSQPVHLASHSAQQSPSLQHAAAAAAAVHASGGGIAPATPGPVGTVAAPQGPIVQVQVQPAQPMDPVTQSTAETWLSIASLAETLGDADRAAMAYDATLQYNPSSTKALTSLAHLYRSRDMFQRAAELYQRALAVNPELGDIWATLGHCYLMLDDLQSAYAAYQQALYHLSNPNVPKLWHGIGILYDRYGSLDYAEEAFAKVLELDPQFEKANEIYFRLGIIYKHQGRWNQALECFRYILTQPPAPLQEWDIWFQLGGVLESMSEWQGAREAYEHVLMQNERHAKVLQQLGCLYGMQSVQFYDTETALNLLLKSLEVDPADATTWYHLGRIHMVRNDYTAAYDAFQHAVNRDSRNPTFWCSIGVLYYQISQYRDALDAYTRAIRLNPYISEVWYDLGTLYETCSNQLTDALDAYKQAARLDPNNIHIRERLDTLTAQLSNQSNGSVLPAQNKPGNVSNPPPIMLQPSLRSNDAGNPLNKSPLSIQHQVETTPVQPHLQVQHQPQSMLQPQLQAQQLQQQQAQAQQVQAELKSRSHQLPQGFQQILSQPQLQMPQQQQPQQRLHGLSQPAVPGQPTFSPYRDSMPPMAPPQGIAGNTQPSSQQIAPLPLTSYLPASNQLPQKRGIEGGMDTLVNAAVSTAANSSSQSQVSPNNASIAPTIKPEGSLVKRQKQTPVQAKEQTTEDAPKDVTPDPEPAAPKVETASKPSSDESGHGPVENEPKADEVPVKKVASEEPEKENPGTTDENSNSFVIKASADAIEQYKEEARLRKEDEQEAISNEVKQPENGKSTGAFNENVVRNFDEDEDYDD